MKKLLGIGLAVILLIAGALWVVISRVDESLVKGRVISALEARLGGKVSIEDAALSPFPRFSLDLKSLQWESPPEKGVSLTVEKVSVRFSLLAVLGEGPIEATLALHKPLLVLHKAPAVGLAMPVPYRVVAVSDSTSGGFPIVYAALDGEGAAPAPAKEESSFGERIGKRVVLSELEVSQGTVVSESAGAKSTAVENLNLDFGPFSFDAAKVQTVDLDLSFDLLEGPLQGPMALKGAFEVRAAEGKLLLQDTELSLLKEKFQVSGTVSDWSRENPDQALIDLAIKNPAFDIGKWSALTKAKEGSPKLSGVLAVDLAVKERLGALKAMSATHALPSTLALSADIDFPKLAMGDETLQNGHLTANLASGILNLKTLRLALAGGSAEASGTVSNLSAVPSFNLALNLKGVNPKQSPLPAVREKLQGVEGTLSASLQLSGQGKTQEEIGQSLSGSGNVELSTISIPERKLSLSGVRAELKFSPGEVFFDPLTIQAVNLEDPKMVLQNVKLKARYAQDILTVESLGASLLGGTLQLNGDVRSMKTASAFEVTMRADGLDLSKLPPKPGTPAGGYHLGGTAMFSVRANGVGKTPRDMQQGIKASGNFEVRNMPLPAVDMASRMGKKQAPAPVAARLEKLKPHLQEVMSVKRLDRFSGSVQYTGGAVHLADTLAVNPNYTVKINGDVSAQKALNLEGQFYIVKAQADAMVQTEPLLQGVREPDGRLRFPFTVHGTADTPKVEIDYREIVPQMIRGAILQNSPGQGGGPRKIIEQIFRPH